MDHVYYTPHCRKWYIIFLVFSIGYIASGCSRPANEMERIIAQARKGDNLVVSGKGSMIFDSSLRAVSFYPPLKGKPDRNPSGHVLIDIDVAFDHDKQYFKYYYQGRSAVPVMEMGFDGKRMWSSGIITGDKYGEYVEMGSYLPFDPSRFDPFHFDPRVIGMSIFQIPVGSFLRMAYRDSTQAWKLPYNPRVIRQEKLDSVLCSVVEIPWNRGKDGKYDTWTLWLAPEYRYRAMKIELTEMARELIDTHRITYQKQDNGSPFPVHIESMSKIKGETISHWTLSLNKDWRLNIPLPDSLFQLRIPEDRQGWSTISANEFLAQ